MAKYNIVISGYYGFNNAGDEAMLTAILQALRNTFDDPEITVISGNPEATAKAFGVRAVPRFPFLPSCPPFSIRTFSSAAAAASCRM